MSETFTLRARREGGGTPTLNSWGANSDYGVPRFHDGVDSARPVGAS